MILVKLMNRVLSHWELQSTTDLVFFDGCSVAVCYHPPPVPLLPDIQRGYGFSFTGHGSRLGTRPVVLNSTRLFVESRPHHDIDMQLVESGYAVPSRHHTISKGGLVVIDDRIMASPYMPIVSSRYAAFRASWWGSVLLLVWIVSFGYYVVLLLPWCSRRLDKVVGFYSLGNSWLCRGSSIVWTAYLMWSRYIAWGLLSFYCRSFQWCCTTVFLQRSLAVPFSAVLAGTCWYSHGQRYSRAGSSAVDTELLMGPSGQRYLGFGSAEETVLVMGPPSLSQQLVMMYPFGNFAVLRLPRCSMWVRRIDRLLSSWISWFSQGSSMIWTTHWRPSRYNASSVLCSLCRWFQWYRTAVSLEWSLAPLCWELLACTSRSPKSSPNHDIMHQSLSHSIEVDPFTERSIVGSSHDFNSIVRKWGSTAVLCDSCPSVWRCRLLLLIVFGYLSSPSTSLWKFLCVVAVGFQRVYTDLALGTFFCGSFQQIGVLLIRRDVAGVSVVSLPLLRYCHGFAQQVHIKYGGMWKSLQEDLEYHWVVLDESSVMLAEGSDPQLFQKSNGGFYLIEELLDALLPRCSKWIDCVLLPASCSEKHDLIDDVTSTCWLVEPCLHAAFKHLVVRASQHNMASTCPMLTTSNNDVFIWWSRYLLASIDIAVPSYPLDNIRDRHSMFGCLTMRSQHSCMVPFLDTMDSSLSFASMSCHLESSAGLLTVCWSWDTCALVVCTSWLLTIACLTTAFAHSCWLLAADALIVPTNRSSSMPHLRSPGVVPLCWYEVLVFTCPSLGLHRHDQRYSKVGSAEECVLVKSPSLFRGLGVIVSSGDFMDVSLPRCSEGVDKIVGIQRVYTNLALNFRVT